MEIFSHLLIVLEMLFVNLSTLHICSKKKYSTKTIVLLLVAYSAVIIGASLFFLRKTTYYGNGNGLFVLIGFLFLFPAKFLYDEMTGRIIQTICSAWIYSMLTFSISLHIGKFFSQSSFALITAAVQTAIYALTLLPFWRFVRERFYYVLQHIGQEMHKQLRFTCLMWFFTAICINLTFVVNDNALLKIASLLFLAANAMLTYRLLFRIVNNSLHIGQLEKIIYIDHLTGLKNRAGMFEDLELAIAKKASFSLVFMDLNSFKSINDTKGHLAGDHYLCAFANAVNSLLKDDGKFYRISGDEFICLYFGTKLHSFLSKCEHITFHESEQLPQFLGVSAGVSNFPSDAQEANELMKMADKNMYRAKKQ